MKCQTCPTCEGTNTLRNSSLAVRVYELRSVGFTCISSKRFYAQKSKSGFRRLFVMSFNIERKKAQFTPESVPPGSVCLSFVAARNGKAILCGRMDRLDIWLDRFYVSPTNGPNFLASGKLLLPASHLLWYESPRDAAMRIMREMALLEVPKEKFKLVGVQSHLRPSPKDPSLPHWDICFVYSADLPITELKQPEWFKDFGFKTNLKADDFTRGHGDVLEEAGLLN